MPQHVLHFLRRSVGNFRKQSKRRNINKHIPVKAPDITRDKDYALVVCSGGDGTLDEIVTGMIQSGFKLIFPQEAQDIPQAP